MNGHVVGGDELIDESGIEDRTLDESEAGARRSVFEILHLTRLEVVEGCDRVSFGKQAIGQV